MKKSIAAVFLLFSTVYAQQHIIIPESRIINDLLTRDIEDLNFQSPLILSNSILFFYKGSAQSVEISGSFVSWRSNIKMEESRSNLWVLNYKDRLDSGEYLYRIKVDGYWIADPMNPESVMDYGRERLSVLKLNRDFVPDAAFPFWISNNTYLFRYKNTNAQIVTIAGDFNNWNPYSHQLEYKGAGIFETELILEPKKIYLYSFVEDGHWVADPDNKQQFVNDIGRPVSGFYADGADSKP